MGTMNTTTDTIKWHRLGAGLYEATFARPEHGVTVRVTVERGDEYNALDADDRGFWRSGHVVERDADGAALDSDSTAWEFRTKRDAVAAAEDFARTCRPSRYGWVL